VILVPLGHGETTVRRLPWVTFSLMALCVGVHLALLTAPRAGGVEVPDVGAADAWAYWEERPYLEIAPELLDAVGAPSDEARRASLVDTIRMQRAILSPDDPAVLVEEQAELDRMTEIAVKGVAAVSGDPAARFGYTPARPSAIGLVTHPFVHAGWIHLLGSLLLLFVAAPALEERFGRLLFGGLYLASGLAGAAAHAAFAPRPDLPWIGASAAIAGATGAFLVRFAGTRVRCLGRVEAPGWILLPLWIAGALASGMLGTEQGIAVWAHAGGFAFGAAFALGLRAARVEERRVAPATERTTASGGKPSLARALAARQRGDLDEAWRLLQSERRLHPHDADLVGHILELALARNDAAAAAPAVLTLVKRLAMTGDVAGAAARWRELVQHAPAARGEPRTLLAIAQTLRDAGDAEGAALALRHASGAKGVGASLAGRIAHEARDIAPDAAAGAVRRTADVPPGAPPAPRARPQATSTPPPATPVVRDAAPAPAEDPPWMLTDAIEPDAVDLEAVAAAEAAPGAPAPAPGAAWEDMDARAVDFDASEGSAVQGLELAGEPFVTHGDEPPEAAARDVAVERAAPEEPAPPVLELPGDLSIHDDGLDLGSDLAAATALPRFAKLETTSAVVRELRETEIALTIVGRDRAVTLTFSKIQAIALAEIASGGSSHLVLDLALSWSALAEGGTLRVVRLRGEAGPAGTGVSAPLRLLAEEISQRSGAAALTPAVNGGDTPRFQDLALYEREILLVGD
jgi:membrane associated rhomboid family serine protease